MTMTSYPLVASFRLLSNFSGSSRAQLDKWVDIKGAAAQKRLQYPQSTFHSTLQVQVKITNTVQEKVSSTGLALMSATLIWLVEFSSLKVLVNYCISG